MAKGLEISRDFIEEIILPLLKREFGDECDKLAVAIVGTGSDVLGLDDRISRDHHWGPRANVLYRREDEARFGDRLNKLLRESVPDTYSHSGTQRYEVHLDVESLTGVCSSQIEHFFEFFLGTSVLPQNNLEWLALCEVDLFHVTHGEVVYDGLGEFTRRRSALAYYPEEVWKKRLADWCMYITGREAPYNYHRVTKRGDAISATAYLGLYMKRVMEMCFTLNRVYAPYTKWLNRLFRMLPKVGPAIAPMLDALVETTDARKQVDQMIEINYSIADGLHDLGLTTKVKRRAFDEGLTDLTLYDSAAQIYTQLPQDLVRPSFNTIEMWEKMARMVLLDPHDYFKSEYSQNN